MVANIAAGGNAREKQPCVRGAGIGNFTQTTEVQKVMISYRARSRISFAPTLLKISGRNMKFMARETYIHIERSPPQPSFLCSSQESSRRASAWRRESFSPRTWAGWIPAQGRYDGGGDAA
ncbi:MAG TPA: hypothetical protein DEB63_18615 [Agrobacterium sp.]|nr:hypothetical protein [Agrobacterium sp.]